MTQKIVIWAPSHYHNIKPDSIRWFSHRHRSGGWHNCITYLHSPAPRTAPKNWSQRCLTIHSMQANASEHCCQPQAATQWYRLLLPYYALSMGIGDDSAVFLSRWPLTLTFELGWDFCTMHLTTKFHHPTFNRSEVIMLTNKQTLLKTSTSLRYAMPVHKRKLIKTKNATQEVP